MIYDPRIVVKHFHGRRDPADLLALYRGYGLADGAAFAKHFLRSTTIRKMCARSLIWGVQDLFRKPNPNDPIRRLATFKAVRQVQGFAAYIVTALILG